MIVFGSRADATGEPLEGGLFAPDPESGRMQPLARGVIPTSARPALAGRHDGRTAIVSVRSGALYRLLEVPLDGGDKTRTLLTSTQSAIGIDEGPDGAIYADQFSSAEYLMRFPPAGGAPGTSDRGL